MTDLYDQPGVLTTQLNHYAKPRSLTPNDSLFSQQWALLNTGQTGGVAGIDINVAPIWNKSTGGVTALGDTIVVAVIDNGMDLSHQDLVFHQNTQEIPNNGIDDDHNGYIDDYNGWNSSAHDGTIPSDFHGTQLCGIIGAIGNNHSGICGTNWAVKILPIVTQNYTEAEIVEDYTYIFDQRKAYNNSGGTSGAFVVTTCSSFGIDLAKPADFPLWCAAYDSLGKVGILSAAATADQNYNIDVSSDMPTACPSDYLVTVTNMTSTGARYAAAGYGLTTIDIEAPGTSIVSTVPGDGYALGSGTSFACPYVSGAIALMYAVGCERFDSFYVAKPDSMALRIKHYIIAAADTMPDMIGNSVSAGRLDVYASSLRLLNDFCDTCYLLNVDQQMVTCNGAADGSATLSIINGVPPYQILWSTGDTTYHRDSLGAGTYNIQVTDSTGCQQHVYFQLTQPDAILTGFTVTRDTDNLSTGAITTQIQGGTPPYHFTWSNGDTAQSPTGLSAGTYYVIISDAHGCSIQDSILVGALTGIDNPQLASQIKLYPNPTNGDVTLLLPATNQPATIELMDLPGRVLYTSQTATMPYVVPLSQMSKGVYLLRVTMGNAQVVKKVVRL